MQEEHQFNFSLFLLGVLSIWASLIAFRDPVSSLTSIVVLVSIVLTLKGIVLLVNLNETKGFFGNTKTNNIILGMIYLIVGIGLALHIWQGLLLLPYVFAIWFIVNSIFYLFNSSYLKEISKPRYIFSLIINIIGVFIGISLLFDPISSAITASFLLGFYFLVLGIEEIVFAF